MTLAHPCSDFSQCCGLNRFLVLLASRYLRDAGHPDPLRPDTAVEFVNCHHRAPFGPQACYGQPHEVWFQQADCVARGASLPEAGTHHDVVIIRHGVDPAAKRGRTPALHPRELLPYHAGS